MSTMKANAIMEWNHPNLGMVTENVCVFHEADLLSALRMLGIGSGGTYADEGATCLRCQHSNPFIPPRVWLRKLFNVVSGESA